MGLDLNGSQATLHDDVVRAAAHSYELQGEDVVPYWQLNGAATGDDPDLIIPRLRRIEVIETADTLSALDVKQLLKHREAGVEVWILVPIEEVGRVQQELRGSVDRIQGWWQDQGSIRFEKPRHP